MIFLVAVFFLALYLFEFEMAEVQIMGLKVENIDFTKVVFLVPVLITLQYTYYSLGRL